MDAIVDYLLTARSSGREAKVRPRAAAPAGPAALPAERRDARGGGAPNLLDLLRDRLGDETVRRAIVRLIAPR